MKNEEPMFAIKMTAAQRDHAEWALDPMMDIPECEGWYTEADLPSVHKDGQLVFPTASMAIDDILYRLEEQLRSMAEQAIERYPRSAATLAKKIRAAAIEAGWKATMGSGWRELQPAEGS